MRQPFQPDLTVDLRLQLEFRVIGGRSISFDHRTPDLRLLAHLSLSSSENPRI